jgi:hypothetical protein
VDDGIQHPPVQIVQSQVIDFMDSQGFVGHPLVDDAIGAYLRIVAYPTQQTKGHPGRAAGAAGDLLCADGVDRHVEQGRGP